MMTSTKPATAWTGELPEMPASPIRRCLAELAHRAAHRLCPPPEPPLPDPESDPATPENLNALGRRLLIGAIRRYEEASDEWAAVHESFPALDPPRQPSGPEEIEERRRWLAMLHHADENFNNAELNLAERIHGLVPMLDPEGRPPDRDEDDYFVPRAVRHGGSVYVLAYSAWEYEPRQNIIAVYRDSMVLDVADDTK
jgi:hypothetical protein